MTESDLITRREAILRVTALLGGVALVGGSALLTGCRPSDQANTDAPFSTDEIAFLDEVAETILPQTSTPGAKAAHTGAFMAMMATDTYDARNRKVFRDGIRTIDDATKKAHNVGFMQATPQQRLAVLEVIDRDQKSFHDARRDESRKKSLAWLQSDPRQEAAPGPDVTAAPAITDQPPPHYFRMMKELALLGYFTSEIGATQAQRYIESPGRYDPCVPYSPGDKSWAPHA